MQIAQQRDDKLSEIIHKGGGFDLSGNCYGAAVYMDSHHPCGGNGGFIWVKEKETFIELARYLPYFFVDIQNPENNHQVWDEVNPIVDLYQSGQLTLEQTRLKMNEALSPTFLVIEWWGIYDDLRTSENQFAKDLRERYWEEIQDDEEEEPKNDAIPDEMKDEFASWVKDFV
ncbi:MAG: hypothetical protein CL609_15045 [Anaerolineaceae bacterium]|nr:hypothetical protein [Anaerolineaceae bacterium]